MAKNYIENMLGENERIGLVTHQHWFVLVSAIAVEVLVTVIVVAVILGSAIFNPLAAYGFTLIVIPLAIMTRDILAWSNHMYVVTNRRVIQISGILNKSVVDSSLEKVNDVKLTQSVFGRLFDYGDVEIMTASDLGVNLFKRIGDPVNFKTAMLNAKEKMGFDERGANPARADDIPALIAELDELRKKGIVTEAEFQKKKTELLAKM